MPVILTNAIDDVHQEIASRAATLTDEVGPLRVDDLKLWTGNSLSPNPLSGKAERQRLPQWAHKAQVSNAN